MKQIRLEGQLNKRGTQILNAIIEILRQGTRSQDRGITHF